MLGKIKQDEREEMPGGAVVLERVVWVAPEKVTLRRKLKEIGRVEEHGRGDSRCKGPETERRPSMVQDSKGACVVEQGDGWAVRSERRGPWARVTPHRSRRTL